MNILNLLEELEDNHDNLRVISNHPQLLENGWAVAEKLVPFIRQQLPDAVEILKHLAIHASPKEMIMCCIEILSLLDESSAQVFVHYAGMYLDGMLSLLSDSIK